MHEAKANISKHMKIEQTLLNEVALEDIEFAEEAAMLISKTVEQLLTASDPVAMLAGHADLMAHGVPCKGYWIETSKDLVLYIWNRDYWRTIVLPQRTWSLRPDITLH